MTQQGAHQWRGLIEEYRHRLPVTAATPVVTLCEGGTPLVYACVLSEMTGCAVWLKYDGANPTGSFKDRGMTMAISKAAEAGAPRRQPVLPQWTPVKSRPADYRLSCPVSVSFTVIDWKRRASRFLSSLYHERHSLSLWNRFLSVLLAFGEAISATPRATSALSNRCLPAR